MCPDERQRGEEIRTLKQVLAIIVLFPIGREVKSNQTTNHVDVCNNLFYCLVVPFKNIYQKLDFVQINYHLHKFSHQTVKYLKL